MQSIENGALLPPNTIVGTCGTRSLFGCLLSGCDDCDGSPIRCPGPLVSVADQLHELMLVCNELDDSMAEYFFIQAARQFAVDSKLLKRDAVFDSTAGDSMFCLGAPDGEEVYGIRAVCLNGVCSTMGIGDTCAAPWGSFQYRLGKGGSLVLRMPMDCCGRVRVTYYTRPKSDACSIDSALAGYVSGITALAASRLLAMPSKPWSGMGSVKYYEKLYYEALGQAKFQEEFAGSHPQYLLEHGDQCTTQFVARNPY